MAKKKASSPKSKTRDEIRSLRKSGVPDTPPDRWMNDPKVAKRTRGAA